MELHDFNARLLNSLNIIDETGEGHLSRRLGDSYTPFTIGGKRVVLPTSQNLREVDKNTIVFHPLSENITRGESDVLKAMRDSIMYELTMRSVSVMLELARVAATPSEHKRLDPSSSKYLKDLQDMDEKTYLFLKDKVLMRVGPEPEKRLISISLRKGDKRDGVLRRVQFKFPVLEVLLSDEPSILGVKYPSQKARNTLRTLFQIVLGDEETRAGFDYGSKNHTAPYLHALLMGYSNLAEHLNRVIATHKKLLTPELANDLTTDLSWFEGLEEMAEMRRVVPPQEGNQGSIIVQEGTGEQVTEKVATRLMPADRRHKLQEATADDSDTPPWEETVVEDDRRDSRRDTAPAQAAKPRGKSLDEYLGRGREPEHDPFARRGRERGSRFEGRDERRPVDRREVDRFSRDRRDDDRGFGRGRNIDLGRDRDDRDIRGGRDSRWDSRRDDRGFGQGHRHGSRF